MEKLTAFRSGEIIMLDGLYGCAHRCGLQSWGVAGRRFPSPPCGHEGGWQLIRRRLDNWW